MIPFVPIAFAVLAFLAWRYDARARRAYEATLSEAEKRQFRALRRVHPSKWRAAIALKQAETRAQDARVTRVPHATGGDQQKQSAKQIGNAPSVRHETGTCSFTPTAWRSVGLPLRDPQDPPHPWLMSAIRALRE